MLRSARRAGTVDQESSAEIFILPFQKYPPVHLHLVCDLPVLIPPIQRTVHARSLSDGQFDLVKLKNSFPDMFFSLLLLMLLLWCRVQTL